MCDAQTGIMFAWEPYEGKVKMAHKEFVNEKIMMPDGTHEQLGKEGAQILRLPKPYFGTPRLEAWSSAVQCSSVQCSKSNRRSNRMQQERCIIADSAFASYKLAVALLQRGLYLIGNVKTAHSGFPKLKLQAMADVRGKTATATTIVCLSGSNQEHVILATSDRDKQPMSCICTAGTSAGPVIIHRWVKTIHKDGKAKVSGKTFSTLQASAYYRKHFNAVAKHNAKRQGGHCLEDDWRTHQWILRDFQAMYGATLVNSLLAMRFFMRKPELAQWKFQQRLCEQLQRTALAEEREAPQKQRNQRAQARVSGHKGYISRQASTEDVQHLQAEEDPMVLFLW
eukprot:CAMPEP_0117655502 /NCGR_PEP_ID=MMETSP0804-20121206/4312_1 /TAXON_ID=1074897 /ORGANISM="Tetraselmis astigmatica, Strain CCMP880" /LENGTH=338 /DNA_ID=CAMNT_0005461855 /DNA_START=334 /DNA_END=1351 /DNA_ORIENTATION=+